MVRRGNAQPGKVQAKSTVLEYFRAFWHLVGSTLSARQIQKENISSSILFTVLFTMFCNLVLNLAALYVGLCVRKLELSVFQFLYGACRRFVGTTSTNLFFSSLLASFCGEDLYLVFQITTSTLMLFSPALFIYGSDILEPRLVFTFYILLSMRLITKSLKRNNQGCELYRRRAFKVCVIVLQYTIFCSIKSTLFIDF